MDGRVKPGQGEPQRLALGRRDVLHLGGKGGDVGVVVFEVAALGDGRLVREADAGAARGLRPDRPLLEPAAAIRADIVEVYRDAIRAERALIGADPRIWGVGRQILVAPFAIGSELEHFVPSSSRHGRA